MTSLLFQGPARRCAIMLVVAVLSIGATRSSSERVVQGSGIVTAIVNGVPLRMRIDPGAVAMPMITTVIARRARLKPGPFDFEYLVGTKRVNGKSAVTRIDLGWGPMRRRVAWTDAPYIAGVDGVIGPGLLPAEIVRFQLGPSRVGERTISLPMAGQGGLQSRWGSRFALVQVGGTPMRVQFDPGRQRTIATANAGVRIAAAHSGTLSTETRPVEVAFGIERPVRSLRLQKPLKIGPLSIHTLGVRTSDFGSATSIRTDPAETVDPNEIVVVGSRKGRKLFDHVILGQDHLDHCSSIAFDKNTDQIRMTCL